ncbi:cache domain-containing sensor histidine kinase [Kineothrix sp. MB12-C1]|uniref:cache domain-containing sensor histidine kinase n=1 Tax=Kineothrix sp. MB12-C1 TaxID=3070215 RepID=UPI0027D25091|nr:sensor histidine kinase [Kineothrix sp. MB12-C1]WMC91924.1 sensor histidine kinase [Kineothrix sp. MB12-C1]
MKIDKKSIGNKTSLQTKLICLFLVTSVIPLFILSVYSYYNTSNTLKKNMEELTLGNLEQTGNSLEIWLESYEDLLYQIYTNDDVVKLIDKLNNGEDDSVTRNQLRRMISGLINTKDYIRAITIITSENKIVTYNQLTPYTNESSWINNFSMGQKELYDEISSDNKTHIFSTEYAVSFANEDYYLFHISHRIIDYKDLEKRNGVVIISIDEELLKRVCLAKDEDKLSSNNFNFIVDKKGNVISYPDSTRLMTKITDGESSSQEKKKDYLNFIYDENLFPNKYTSLYVYENKGLEWDVVNVVNQKETMIGIANQQRINIAACLLCFGMVIILTLPLSRQLAESVQKVVRSMETVSSGNLETRVTVDKQMPLEVEFIAIQFNDMLEKLDAALKKEKEAGERQRLAEITALEAQINPHFLYNTLDTINWMAIDKDEFEISNAINTLASILRYAIKNSNATVTVREEVSWLKNYIYLQQTRLKNTFRCNIDIDKQIADCKIHKLLLQPFIENSIIHGFERRTGENILTIRMEKKEEYLQIMIGDNGNGIEPAFVERLNERAFHMMEESENIGIANAFTRLFMYYGEDVHVEIRSVLEEGTEIIILIPWRLTYESDNSGR